MGDTTQTYTMIAILITVIMGCPLGHAMSMFQPYYIVGTPDQVSLHCTYKIKNQPKELRVSVYKGMHEEKMICSAFVNVSNPNIVTDGDVYCTGKVSNGRIDLTIFGLKANDTDLYKCQVEVLFPPPYIKKVGNGTLLYIPAEIPSCPTEPMQAKLEDIPETTHTEAHSMSMIMLLAIFITTIISLVLQMLKMIMAVHKSSSLPQTHSQNGYKIFW